MARLEQAGTLVHVGDHVQQAPRRGEGRGQRPAFRLASTGNVAIRHRPRLKRYFPLRNNRGRLESSSIAEYRRVGEFVTAARDVLAFTDNMRRFFASLVLSVMALSLLAPMAQAATGAGAPSCCRRNGKHHCMSGISGTVAVSTDSLPGFRASSPVCPSRWQTATPTGLGRPQISTLSGLLTPSATILRVDALVSSDSCFTTRNSERGPPAPRP